YGVVVQARCLLRAVPDLPQRTLALRAPPGSGRSGLPGHVRRPHPRSTDAVTTDRRSWRNDAFIEAVGRRAGRAWTPARRLFERIGVADRRVDHVDIHHDRRSGLDVDL